MSTKLKIKRGLASNLSLSGVLAGELKYTTDTERLYIGDGTTNKPIGGADAVFKDETQTLKNKTLNAKDNFIFNIDALSFESGVIKDAIRSDYYYGWYFSNYRFTKQVTAGTVEVFEVVRNPSTLKISGINSLGYGTISNGVLVFNSTTYQRSDTNDGFYILGSDQKIPNVDALIDMFNLAVAAGGSGVVEVDSLPTTHDQTKIYKIPNSNVLWWWNGSEYADISSEAGMVEITTFPTGSEIKQGLLYKLIQDISHQGDAQYLMLQREFIESTTTIADTYTHNATTDKWYYGTTEIHVLIVQSLPEPSSETNNNYYFTSGSLYQCKLARPTIIDYYAGVYAYFNSGWRALYTSNMMVDYNTGIAPSSMPSINNKKVMGDHDITYYGGVTASQIEGTYQPKTMTNPLAGFVADTVEGTLAEINTKISSATRIKGSVPTYADLPASPATGDMWVVKTDTTQGEIRTNIMYCYNGVDWFEYGSSDIDMSAYQKFEEKIDSLKAANPSLTFSEGSTVAQNDNFTLVRLEATLQSPITDIQSPDRTIMVFPNDINANDGDVDVKVLTHEGQFTAQENVPELPSGASGSRDFVMSIDPSKLIQAYKMTRVKFEEVHQNELTGVWYEHDEDNDIYYLNGTALTINAVSTLPEPSASNIETYYKLNSNQKIYVSELTYGVPQDVNISLGELIWGNKQESYPSIKQSNLSPLPQIYSSGTTVWVLDTDNMSPIGRNWIVGYVTQTGTRFDGEAYSINVPLYRCKQITLTLNTSYVEACKRMDSGLNVDVNGRYGYYSIVESDLSKKYSMHGASSDTTGMQANLPHGFDGTYTFTPAYNNPQKQHLNNAYIQNGALKVQGDVTIDKIYIMGVLS